MALPDCLHCGQPGRRLNYTSAIAWADYYRCDGCGQVWSSDGPAKTRRPKSSSRLNGPADGQENTRRKKKKKKKKKKKPPIVILISWLARCAGMRDGSAKSIPRAPIPVTVARPIATTKDDNGKA